MLRLYAPVAVTVVLVAISTFFEARFSDRFNTSDVTKEEFDQRFSSLPKEVGPWVGTDNEVGKDILQVAGAVNHVSRTYLNNQTGAKVDLWLIVGHSRDIVRHTPDICYPAHGFGQDDIKPLKQVIKAGGEDATFYTARFRNEQAFGGGPALQRVFWGWNANTDDEHQWIAPDSAKRYFGNNRRLYKMYFTANMTDRDEPVGENAAVAFAKVMLPEVNHALFPKHYPTAPSVTAAEETTASPEMGGLEIPGSVIGPAKDAAAAGDSTANPADLPAAAPTE
jgi:hypothetical protein